MRQQLYPVSINVSIVVTLSECLTTSQLKGILATVLAQEHFLEIGKAVCAKFSFYHSYFNWVVRYLPQNNNLQILIVERFQCLLQSVNHLLINHLSKEALYLTLIYMYSHDYLRVHVLEQLLMEYGGFQMLISCTHVRTHIC